MKGISGFFILAFVSAILMSACSGGGGGANSGGIMYTGVTTQAPLTVTNANIFFSMMLSGGISTGSVPLSPAVSKTASPGGKSDGTIFIVKRLGKRLTSDAVRFRAGSNNGMRATSVNETYTGVVSGTLTMTGSIDETTFMGSMTMTFTNFNDGDGYTIDGVVTVRIDGFDRASGNLTDATMSFTSWTMKSAGSDFTLGGSIRIQGSAQDRSETLTINMVGRNNIGNDSFRFENYVETTVYDNLQYPTSASETYSGRVYAGQYGYVDVSTASPCIYSNPQDEPSSGGPIMLVGAGNTRAAMTPISATYVKIEVDADGNGVFEEKNTYSWSNLDGSPVNVPPVANAGPDQNIMAGSVVTLDGSGSTDANGELLTYSWSFTLRPAGSAATLSSSTAVNPTFTADKNGSYVLTLVVSDGQVNSAADTVTITAATANSTPLANAGPDQNVLTGSLVTLTGSGSSDANGDLLTYNWSFTSKPAGSAAALSSSTAVNPTFTADVEGTYVLSLVVDDGTVSSSADSITITATSSLLVIDQEQPVIDISVGGVGIGGSSQEKLAQVVTAGLSGMLTAVRFPVACAFGDLIIEIQGVTGGIPNGAVLTSKTIPAASLPSFFPTPGVVSFRSLVLTTPVPISAGSQFAIVLDSAGECGVFRGPVGDSYPGGQAYFDARPNAAGVWVCICDFEGDRFDLPFQTLVEPAN